MVSLLFFNNKVNIFGVWSVGWTKQDVSLDCDEHFSLFSYIL